MVRNVRKTGYSRRRTDVAGQRATTLQLTYDLMFATTQVSHLPLEHLTWAGVGQSLLMLLVVWWPWNCTTWVTDELDTDPISMRLVMIYPMPLKHTAAARRARCGEPTPLERLETRGAGGEYTRP